MFILLRKVNNCQQCFLLLSCFCFYILTELVWEGKNSLLDQTQSGWAILFLAPVLFSVLPNFSKNLAKSVFSESPTLRI